MKTIIEKTRYLNILAVIALMVRDNRCIRPGSGGRFSRADRLQRFGRERLIQDANF
jgi:hypothetical protein